MLHQQKEKAELRARFVSRCRALPGSQRQVKSGELVRHLIGWKGLCGIRALALYAARAFEIDPGALRKWAYEQGIRVFFPKVFPAESRMEFVAVDPGEELVKGTFSILEPDNDGPRLTPAFSPMVVLVPGVAFDPSGVRLGSGRGYYDRTLVTLGEGVRVIGLGYCFQVTDWLPRDPWDVSMDLLGTEAGIVHCHRAGGELADLPSRGAAGK